MQYQRGNFASILSAEGLTDQNVTKTVTIPIQIVFAGKVYNGVETLTYKAVAGSRSTASGKD